MKGTSNTISDNFDNLFFNNCHDKKWCSLISFVSFQSLKRLVLIMMTNIFTCVAFALFRQGLMLFYFLWWVPADLVSWLKFAPRPPVKRVGINDSGGWKIKWTFIRKMESWPLWPDDKKLRWEAEKQKYFMSYR